MKKAFSACFAVLWAVFLFAACAKTSGDAQNASPFFADASVSLPAEASALSPADAAAPSPAAPREQTNNIRFIQQAYPLGDGNGNGYYMFQYREDASCNIKYIDYGTQQEIVLCSRPECTHDNETCSAWRPYCGSTGSVIPIGDTLYLMYWGAHLPADVEQYGENALPHIEKAWLDGTHAQPLTHFSPNENFTGGLAYDDQYIYAAIVTTQKRSDGETETFYRIASISRSDGALSYSGRFDEMNLCIEGAAGNHLLLSYYGTAGVSSLEELRKIYALYDPVRGSFTPVDPGSTDGHSCMAYNGNLLVLDKTAYDLKMISIATGEPVHDVMHLNVPRTNDITLAYGCGDLLIVYTYPDDQPMTPYLFSLSEQTAYPILLPLQTDAAQSKHHKIHILARYGEKYLVTPSVSYDNIAVPGASTTLPAPEYTFAFLSKEDLLQGNANYSAITKTDG